LTRAFYAQHDTKTPVLIGTVAMGLNVLFSFVFSSLFTRFGWMPHGGLALANSLATAIEATMLFVVMRKRLSGINGTEVARGFGQAALAALGMSLALVIWIQGTGGLRTWAIGLGGVTLGGLAYGAGVLALRVPEVHTVIGMIKRRVMRRAA
jgi:putative peptidoglycan lipid II flippase